MRHKRLKVIRLKKKELILNEICWNKVNFDENSVENKIHASRKVGAMG